MVPFAAANLFRCVALWIRRERLFCAPTHVALRNSPFPNIRAMNLMDRWHVNDFGRVRVRARAETHTRLSISVALG